MDGAGVGESESKHGADVFIARQVPTLVHSIQVAGHRMGGHVGGGDGDDLVKLVEAKLCVEDGADGGEDQLVGGHHAVAAAEDEVGAGLVSAASLASALTQELKYLDCGLLGVEPL